MLLANACANSDEDDGAIRYLERCYIITETGNNNYYNTKFSEIIWYQYILPASGRITCFWFCDIEWTGIINCSILVFVLLASVNGFEDDELRDNICRACTKGDSTKLAMVIYKWVEWNVSMR